MPLPEPEIRGGNAKRLFHAGSGLVDGEAFLDGQVYRIDIGAGNELTHDIERVHPRCQDVVTGFELGIRLKLTHRRIIVLRVLDDVILRENGGDLIARGALGDVDLHLDTRLDRRLLLPLEQSLDSGNPHEDDAREHRENQDNSDDEGKDGLLGMLLRTLAGICRLDSRAVRTAMRPGPRMRGPGDTGAMGGRARGARTVRRRRICLRTARGSIL